MNKTFHAPSPDAYNPTSTVKYKQAPAFGFGSDKQRPDLPSGASKNNAVSPGPGHYKIRSTFTSGVPKYLI